MTNEGIVDAANVADGKMPRQVKCTGWRYKISHGAVLFFGYTKKRVCSPDGGECFATVLFKRVRVKGRKCRVPTSIAFFVRRREAYETALLWCCRQRGIELDPGHEAGSLPKAYRLELLRQLDTGAHRSSLSALPSVLSQAVSRGAQRVTGTTVHPAVGIYSDGAWRR